MELIPFIDAHIHLWKLSAVRYPWLSPPFGDDGPNGSVEGIAADYDLADYLVDMTGWNVVGAVHVEAGADPEQAVDETRWVEGAVAGSLPVAMVAFAALEQPTAPDVLARQAEHPGVRGIRQILNWHPDSRRTYTARDLTGDEAWRANYALLGRHGLSFDLQCYPAQLPSLAPLVASHSDIPVVINHLGMPIVPDDEGLDEWRRGLAAMAAIPHVAIKLSGLGFVGRDWTTGIVAPMIREAVEMFGTDRCMFASDMPTDKLFAPPHRYLDAYRKMAAEYTLDERRDLFGRNANRIYRLGLAI